jgi:hypothetical protein
MLCHFMSERFGSKIASTRESAPIMGNLSDTNDIEEMTGTRVVSFQFH